MSIPYKIERLTGKGEKYSSRLTREQIIAAVSEAADRWEGVRTSDVDLQFTGFLDQVVDTRRELVGFRSGAYGDSAIIFDESGAISGDSNMHGEHAPVLLGRYRARFVIVVNLSAITTVDHLSAVLTHEFGHALGLDHTQANAASAEDSIGSNDSLVPTMYPSVLPRYAAEMASLAPDDIAALSMLYPHPTRSGQHVAINGVVVSSKTNQPIPGVNVIAIPAKPNSHEYSCVSGYLSQNGDFLIWVPPGEYLLAVESIRKSHVGTSSVGQYAKTEDGLSFASSATLPNRVVRKEVYEVIAGKPLKVTVQIP